MRSNWLRETYQQEGETRTLRKGQTSLSNNHRHELTAYDDGRIEVVPTRDHTHRLLQPFGADGQGLARLGPAQGLLLARVPVRGTLAVSGSDRRGREPGINVGHEFKYRKYIEGGTLAAAIWRFEGLREEDFPNGLPLELFLEVFRSYKGDTEQPLQGTIELVKPAPLGADGRPTALDGGLRSVEETFPARDYQVMERWIPRKIIARDAQGNERTVDLFRDLVDRQTGALEIWVRCLDTAQYFGMAPADMYLRAANRPFWANFVKGYLSIWFQMVVVTCFGVTFSTFLSGPVAMLATLAGLVMGFFKGFVFDVASGEMPGGGPLESLVRLFTQQNQMVELDKSLGTSIMQGIDAVFMQVMQAVSYAMPDFGRFNTSRFVAYGYDIPASLMAQHLCITLIYAAVVAAAGYYLFKTREIAA